MIRKCLFCKRKTRIKSIEHIIPESLGNKRLKLKYVVCDECNNHFSKAEDYFCNHNFSVDEKLQYLEKTKKGKPPSFPLSKGGRAVKRDNKLFYSQPQAKDDDYELLTMTFFDKSYEMDVQFQYPEIKLVRISKFLAKCGIETLYYKKGILAYRKEFDIVRNYALNDSDTSYIPFLGKRNQNKKLDIKICKLNSRNNGSFLFSITLLPGYEYWFPLNRIHEKYAYKLLADRRELKKYEKNVSFQRDNIKFKFVWD